MLKKFKSLFIIEEEIPNKSAKKENDNNKKPASTSKGNSIVKSNSSSVSPSNVIQDGKVSEKFLNILFEALEKNNIEGFDYLEFKKSLQSLSKMPMDEVTRFKSAFAMASSMNVSTTQIIDSADFYLQILKKEEEKFNNALAKQKSTKVHAQEEQVKLLEITVKDKAAQIKKLTDEIDQIQKEIQSTNKQIAEQTTKVNKTKNDFLMSYNMVVNQINTDVANIKKHLK